MELPDRLRARLPDARRPSDAAVAIVARTGRGPGDGELLFIRRPRRASDRWSGDVAFPGGLAQPGESAARTAAREAHEEVGLTLGAPAGALGDHWTVRPVGQATPRRFLLRIRPVIFVIADPPPLTLEAREVAEAFWVPLQRLGRLPVVPALRRVGPVPLLVPSLDLDGRVLWGLTFAMVRELRRALG